MLADGTDFESNILWGLSMTNILHDLIRQGILTLSKLLNGSILRFFPLMC